MKTIKVCVISFLVLVSGFCLAVAVSVIGIKNPRVPQKLDSQQQQVLTSFLDTHYSEKRKYIKNLPYSLTGDSVSVASGSAILIDVNTGCILYEKNADALIPPASMTKLVEMYVVFDAVEKGEVSLDDEVPLPPESWAKNLPRDASIMFLAEGQHVTLRELLLGLSIASGNDASIAVAKFVCGSMEKFVERMNGEIRQLGLTKTVFVESSGYSEKNLTTAREFALFCRTYLNKYPFALEEFHAKRKLEYPLERNLPDYQKYKGDTDAVIQYNTNKLLRELEGCDGLKTGFIYESGYNISVTAKRGNRRFLSITMKGPGIGSKEGNYYRVKDNTAMMEYAFAKFGSFVKSEPSSFSVNVAGGFVKAVNLVPVCDESFSVPFIAGDNPEQAAGMLECRIAVPSCITGPVSCGEQIGTVSYVLAGKVLNVIPLVCDREIKTTPLSEFWGRLIVSLAKL